MSTIVYPSENCPECHTRPKWNGVLSHSATCSLIDLETARWFAAEADRRCNRERKNARHFVEAAQRWEGRFRVVCHENNQLRKKLATPPAPLSTEPSAGEVTDFATETRAAVCMLASFHQMLEGMKTQIVAELGEWEWAVMHGGVAKTIERLNALLATPPAPLPVQVQARELEQMIAEIEAAHFRTVEDTGANACALLIWNAVRRRAGLPWLQKSHLPAWDGKQYSMPKDRSLVAAIRAARSASGADKEDKS